MTRSVAPAEEGGGGSVMVHVDATTSGTRMVSYKAWVNPPETDTHQLTHAVDVGLRIAWCGVATRVQRGTWPVDPTLWDSPLGRCPTCARMVYGAPVRSP